MLDYSIRSVLDTPKRATELTIRDKKINFEAVIDEICLQWWEKKY